MFMITHWAACIWFMTACEEMGPHEVGHNSQLHMHGNDNLTHKDFGIAQTAVDTHKNHYKCGDKSWIKKTTTEIRKYLQIQLQFN